MRGGMTMNFDPFGVAIIPLIIALVKLFRTVGIPSRWLPAFALVTGLLAGIFYVSPNDLKGGIIVGLWLGLGAIGLHSGVKNTVQK
jgi:hypothetical protein